MQIVLNNEQLDVTLEQEQNLGDIFSSLVSWMAEGGLYPLGLHVDGTELDINDNAAWQNISLEGIGEFRLEAGNYNDIVKQQLLTALDFINLLIGLGDTEKGVSPDFVSAFSEYEHLRRALPGILQIDNQAFSADFIKLDTAAMELDKDNSNSSSVSEFAARLEQLRVILLDRLTEYNNPGGTLRSTSKLLSDMLPALEEAGVALQTGKERDAFSFMFRLSEMTAKLIRLLNIYSIEKQTSQGGNIKEGLGELTSLLDEINTSITDKDTVLLADLLEYDLREKLEAIVSSIDELVGEDA